MSRVLKHIAERPTNGSEDFDRCHVAIRDAKFLPPCPWAKAHGYHRPVALRPRSVGSDALWVSQRPAELIRPLVPGQFAVQPLIALVLRRTGTSRQRLRMALLSGQNGGLPAFRSHYFMYLSSAFMVSSRQYLM